MHIWALICSLTLAPAQCNFEMADRWFQVAPEKRIDIRTTLTRSGMFDPDKQFIKIFKYGGSLGTSTYIYYPCDSPASTIDEAINAESASERIYLRKQQAKGGCLKGIYAP
jgi:hypothetical protein